MHGRGEPFFQKLFAPAHSCRGCPTETGVSPNFQSQSCYKHFAYPVLQGALSQRFLPSSREEPSAQAHWCARPASRSSPCLSPSIGCAGGLPGGVEHAILLPALVAKTSMDRLSNPPLETTASGEAGLPREISDVLSERQVRTLKSFGRDVQRLQHGARVLAARVRNESVSGPMMEFLRPLFTSLRPSQLDEPHDHHMAVRFQVSQRGLRLALAPPGAATDAGARGRGHADETATVGEPEPTHGLQGALCWLNALLHLPALRRFWERSLRRARFERLCRLMPRAWFLDPVALPPGAVLPGLETTSWDDFVRRYHAMRSFDVVSFRGGDASEWLDLRPAPSPEHWHRVIRAAIQTFPSHPSVLIEIDESGGEPRHLVAEYACREEGRQLKSARMQ